MAPMPEPGSAAELLRSPIKISGAALYGDIRRREVTAVTNSRIDALQMHSEKPKNGPEEKGFKAWFGRTASNVWHEMWHDVYEKRDQLWSMQMHEAAEVPTAIASDIRDKALAIADKRVEERKAAEKAADHSYGLKKFWNKITFAETRNSVKWQEAEGYITDTQKEALTVVREWRDQLKKLDDPNLPEADRAKIIAENPLYGQKLAALSAGEEIATNIGEGLVRTERGEFQVGPDTAPLVLKKDSEAGKALIDKVIKPYLKTLHAGGDADAAWVGAQSELSKIFQSDEFKSYLDTLPPDQKDLLVSDQYATNLRSTLEGLYTSAKDAQDFVQSVDALNTDVEIRLGAVEVGSQTKLHESRLDKFDRHEKNKKIFEFMRKGKVASWFSDVDMKTGMNRDARLAAMAEDTLKNEMVWGAGTGVAIYLSRSALSQGARVFAPVVGGSVVSGFAAGIKEWGRLGTELKQTDIESALGYAFPKTREVTRKRWLGKGQTTQEEPTRRGEMLKFLDQTELQGRNAALEAAMGDQSLEGAKKLFELTADSDARVSVGDKKSVNMFRVKDGTPPGEFDAHSRRLDRLRNEARLKLRQRYSTDTAFKAWIDDMGGMGMPTDATPLDFDGVFQAVKTAQMQTLTKGGKPIDARYDVVFSDLAVDKGKSIEARTRAFNRWRLGKSAIRGGATAGGSMLCGFLVNEVQADIINGRLGSGVLAQKFQETFHIGGPDAHTFDAGNVAQLVTADRSVQLPKGMMMDNSGNLVQVDPNNPTHILGTVVPGFKDHLHQTATGAFEMDDYIKNEAAKHGFKLAAGTSNVLGQGVEGVAGAPHEGVNGIFSGSTHDLVIGGKTYVVPSELQEVPKGDGTVDLVLKFQPTNGVTTQTMTVASGLHQDIHGAGLTDAGVLDKLKTSPLLQMVNHEPTVHTNLPNEAIHGAAGAIDNHSVLHIPQVSTPESTHLVEVSPHTYNLVMDTQGGGQSPLLTGLNIDDHGRLLNITDINKQVELFNSSHDLQLTHTITTETIQGLEKGTGPVSGTVEWKVADWFQMKGGLWEKLRTVNGIGQLDHSPAATNAVKNVFRAYEENWIHNGNVKLGDKLASFNDLPHNPNQTDTIWYNALESRTTFELPKGLFGDDAVAKIAKRASEVAAMYDAGHKAGELNSAIYAKLNPIDKILWDAGVMGTEPNIHQALGGPAEHVLTQERLQQLMDWAGGSGTTETPVSTDLFNHAFTIALTQPPSFVGHGNGIINTVITAVSDVPPIVQPETVPYVPFMLPRKGLEATINVTPTPEIPDNPPTQYGTPYDQEDNPGGYNAENSANSTLRNEAINKAEAFIGGRGEILDEERDEAKRIIRHYISAPELASNNPMDLETYFEEMWQYLHSPGHAISDLSTNNGLVPDQLIDRLTPVIRQISADTTEQSQYAQIMGKYLIDHPQYTGGSDEEFEQRTTALLQAFIGAKHIISPI